MMRFQEFIVLLLCCILCVAGQIPNITQIIESQGYPVQEIWVETSDGFVLSVIRIPGGHGETAPKSNQPSNKPVVFMQHGLLDAATTWVINPPEQSLGFIMADQGFDVFLGNVRGNTYSSQNKLYPNTDKKFWDLIDFDNMIAIDLPTMIDKALEVSGAKSLVYVGHSQGTIMGFGGFSTNYPLAQKVDLFVALAPVAYVSNQESPLLTFLADTDFARWISYFGEEDFLPSDWLVEVIGGAGCRLDPMICANVIFLLTGYDVDNLNMSRVPIYVQHAPAGTSVRNMMHWSQLVAQDEFQMYDYGLAGNLEHYHASVPPLYHPEKLLASKGVPPMAFFTGSKDILADIPDINKLLQVLPEDNKPIYIHNEETYDHMDFVWGENAYERIYPQVVDLALKYSASSQ